MKLFPYEEWSYRRQHPDHPRLKAGALRFDIGMGLFLLMVIKVILTDLRPRSVSGRMPDQRHLEFPDTDVGRAAAQAAVDTFVDTFADTGVWPTGEKV